MESKSQSNAKIEEEKIETTKTEPEENPDDSDLEGLDYSIPVILITEDGFHITCDVKTALKFYPIKEQIRHQLELEGEDNPAVQDSSTSAPVKKQMSISINVPLSYMKYIIKFASHYTSSPFTPFPKPLCTTKITEFLDDQFYIYYCSIPFSELQKYFDHAMYLQYKPLIQITSATIASHMIDKSVDDIRAMFGDENDFSPEEYEKAKQEVKSISEIATEEYC